MAKFSNGKITTNVIFYDRGVNQQSQQSKIFGLATTMNFSMLRQMKQYTVAQKRPAYNLF